MQVRFSEIDLVWELLLRVWGIINALEILKLLVGRARNILSKGVEGDKNKSFIGGISDIASDKEVKSIKNFIADVLVKMLTPDVFINLQNGSLITQFQDTDLKNIDTTNIEDSEIYKKLKGKKTSKKK